MEGNAAGGRGGGGGGHGAASGGRGKNKKARTKAKAAAASSVAAAAAAASAATAKQSGGKKAAAAATSGTSALAGKTRVLKAVKAPNVGKVTANMKAGTVATGLMRKKSVGAKTVAKTKVGTVAAAAAAATASSAASAPKKRVIAKKRQPQSVAEISEAPSSAAGSEHSAASAVKRGASGSKKATVKSTVVSLTGGRRTQGKKRRAGSLSASDHESPMPQHVPDPVQENPSHHSQPPHSIDPAKSSPNGEEPARIAFLGGSATRDSAAQDVATTASDSGSTPVAPTAVSPTPLAPMAVSPTPVSTAQRAIGTKKMKVAKKTGVRVKPTGVASGAAAKTQTTKLSTASSVNEGELASRPKEKANRQLKPQSATDMATRAVSAVEGSVVGTGAASGAALSSARTSSPRADTNTPGVSGEAERPSTASNVEHTEVAVTEDTGEPLRTSSGSNVTTVVAAPVDVQLPTSVQSPPLHQQKATQDTARLQAGGLLELHREPSVSAAEFPVIASMRLPTTAVESVDTASISSQADGDRSNARSLNDIETVVEAPPRAHVFSTPHGTISADKVDKPLNVSVAHDGHKPGMQEQRQGNDAVDAPRAIEASLLSASQPIGVVKLPQHEAPAQVDAPSPTIVVDTVTTAPPIRPHVKIPEANYAAKEFHEGKDSGDGVTSPATLAVRRIFSGEMKRLRAAHYQRSSSQPKHPTTELKPTSTASRKRRREDEDTDEKTSERQQTAPPRSTAAPPAPTSKAAVHLGIVMDSHAYVAKMMRSDSVPGPPPAAETPALAPALQPPNAWGASFGLSGAAPASPHAALSSPASPLASTRPLSSWFLSKGAANFVKRVSFKGDAGGFDSKRPPKRRRISSAAEDDSSSGTDSASCEGGGNPFLASLASHAAWRSWFTPEGKAPTNSLLDPIPTERLPRELLDLSGQPMALSTQELERLEQEIRAEKQRARAFKRMLLLALQGKAASGRAFEDEYGSVLARKRISRPKERP